jgi:large subunit ribosomal protein L24
MSLGIKKGDKVSIITGRDKGKSGKVMSISADGARAFVEGINLVKKHMRRRKEGDPTGVKEMPASIAVSNIAIFCSHCNKGVRFGIKILDGKNKLRVCKKCNQAIS